MPEIVGVRFKRAGKVYYFDPGGTSIKVYDYVVVQTARGMELGQVTVAPKQVLASELTAELKPIVRKATEEDIKRAQDLAAKEDSALIECDKMIARLNLSMKLVSAEFSLDGGRLTFYFTAEERVDFRELVRELTAFFKTRIELRQIGPRDQAKMIGGLGRCGRGLCCGSFLTEFNPVSIKMAKEQDLPLDPMKISGVCGRLQCCLAYESAQYREAKALLPKKGVQVSTPIGVGTVVGSNPLKETVQVEMESKAAVEFPLIQIKVLQAPSGISQQESEAEVDEADESDLPAVAENETTHPKADQSKNAVRKAKQVNNAPTQAIKNKSGPATPEAVNEPSEASKDGAVAKNKQTFQSTSENQESRSP
jgi:cell fate regulator YaaT (PSP1 superfamily)